uniref:Reticulon n=2 Tax=Paramormyrops kingsleyae TaxID=1676925 RepID=A0A3B3T5P7_9TELE
MIPTSLRFRSQPNSFTPVPLGSQSLGNAGEGISYCTKDKQKNMEIRGIDSPFTGTALISSVQGPSAGTKTCTGPLWDDTSPIKTSPVSERIKALEALAAKKGETDTWSDGGFLQFKERHYEKSPTESSSPFPKKDISPDQCSPESPFEVLGDTQRGSDFEDTADWMRAHLPPAPNFDTVPELESKAATDFLVSECLHEFEETRTETVVASVPDEFMDVPRETFQQMEHTSDSTKQSSVDEESEFDMSFLPTAYIWDKQEKIDDEIRGIPALDESKLPPSPPPPAGFGSPTPPPSPPALQLDALEVKPAPWSSDMDPVEIVDLDSSGESDDTVIEDAVSVQAPVSSSPLSDLEDPITVAHSATCGDKEILPAKQEKQAILVPIINVIETDEPALSDEEEAEGEGFQVIEDVDKEQPTPPSSNFEEEKSEQHEDSVDINQSSLQQNTSEDESLPSKILDTETLPLDSLAEISFQDQSSKPDTQTENASSENVLSKEIAGSSPVSEQIEYSDVSQVQFFTQEQTGNEPSLSTVQFSDQLLERSSELQCAIFDPAKQIPSGDLTNSVADNPSISLPSSPENISSHSVLEDVSSKTSTVQLIQEDVNSTEHVPQCDKKLEAESCPPGIKSMSMDIELSSDIETSALSSDSPVQNWAEFVSLSAPSSVVCNTTEIETDFADDLRVVAEDFLPNLVGEKPSPQAVTQDSLSGLQNTPQNVNWEMSTELQPDKDTVSEMNSLELEKVEVPASLSSEDVLTSCESRLLPKSVVDQWQDNQPEISQPKQTSPETTSDPESTELESSVSDAPDSFVEFMRECLKSRQDGEPIDVCSYRMGTEFPKTDAQSFHSPPAMVLDLEQERLTICALKELGSSQEEDEDLPSEKSSQVIPKEGNVPLLTSQLQTMGTAPLPAPTSEPLVRESTIEEVDRIDAWVTDAYHLAEHALTAILTHLSVQDLVYWRDPKKTGVVFSVSLLLLLSLAAFSIISVVSYILLALLCVTISFRVYKSVIQAVQKSSEGHPFKALMEKDVSVPPDTFRKYVDISLSYINQGLKHASRLFLVEDLVDSIKLAVLMWLLTYIGAVFNGITVLILADILLFTLPLLYEKNKTQIDNYVGIARNHINTLISTLQKKLPGVKPKSE